MIALQGMHRYRREVVQVSTQKHYIKVQYLYNTSVLQPLISKASGNMDVILCHLKKILISRPKFCALL